MTVEWDPCMIDEMITDSRSTCNTRIILYVVMMVPHAFLPHYHNTTYI